MKHSPLFVLAASLILAGFLFTADVFAAENYNSSKSNTATAISNAGVGQEDIDRILAEFSVSKTEILINEKLFGQRLAEIGILDDNIQKALGSLRASSFAETDESVTPQELGVGAPQVLPGNPLYFFKNAGRGFRSLFTFSPERKAELSLRFANEKILEAEKLSEQGKDRQLYLHLKNYQKDLERSKEFAKKFEEKNSELAQKFAEKSLKYQIKHQVLFGKFENQAPAETLSDIREIRDKILSHTGETAGTIDDPEKIKEAVLQALGERGGAFKSLRNLEVLKAVEEKVPDRAKNAIRLAQENTGERFRTQFNLMPEEQKKLLGDYMEHAGGDETLYLKAFDTLKFASLNEDAQEKIIEAKEKIFARFEKRANDAIEKNPELARRLFLPLRTGTVDDLRAISDLENNLDPALAPHIFEIKSEAKGNFRARLETFDSEEKRKQFGKEVADRFSDVKQIDLFEDIEESLSKEEQDFTKELKGAVLAQIKERILKAPNESERSARLRTVVGDTPDNLETLQGIRKTLDKQTGDELLSAQAKHFEAKIRHFEDPSQIQFFGAKLEEKPEFRSTIESIRPEFFKEFQQKEQEARQGIDEGRAKFRIDEAERRLAELTKKAELVFSGLAPEIREKYFARAKEVFENSRKHLDRAKEAFDEQKFGEAYGQATSALHMLGSVEELILSVFSKEEPTPQLPAPAASAPRGESAFKECKKFVEEWSSRIDLPDTPKEIVEKYQKCKSILEERKDEGRSILPFPFPIKPPSSIFPVPAPNPEAIVCTQEFAPVCGTDGKTYSNRCTAEKQHRVPVAYEGKCTTAPISACPEIKQPVCGSDNKVYVNECFARQAGIAVIHAGECKASTACPFDRNPVCGANNTTYLNECFMKEAGTTIQYIGDCKTAAAPVLKDRFPLSGPIGTKVTVQGTGFTPAKNTIHFGSGVIPDLASSDGHSLIFAVPEDQVPACAYAEPRCLLPAPYNLVKPGTIYYISVSNENGKSNLLPFTVIAPILPGPSPLPLLIPSTTAPSTTTSPPTTTSSLQGNSVAYSDEGFSPQSLHVKAGTEVTFTNKSSLSFWPASDIHPTHTLYPNSDLKKCGSVEQKIIFDACAAIPVGTSWSFIFSSPGSWKYHNHLNAGHGGAIIVE